jgi:uncharacterized protein (DUF58 family)
MQLFRGASLLFPSAIAWEVALLDVDRSALDEAVAHALAAFWVLTAGALLVRGLGAELRQRRSGSDVGFLEAVDVLTASGCSMAWLGSAAVVGAVWIGWASLSVVGFLGLGLMHGAALWTLVRASGADPWRRASLTRRLAPGHVAEGEPVTEEVRLVSPRIPAGFRLFARGRVGPRWPTSRYAVEASRSRGEVVLERDVGPAVRGEHEAEALEVWLQDVLGLCHSPRIRAGAAMLTVLPRAVRVEGARGVLGPGGSDDEPQPSRRLPQEGTQRLRAYQPGDDARRIHWLRSLAARAIVVRLPDELPPDQPSVRLALDTFHPGLTSGELGCHAAADLLDALVTVWLSVGRDLASAGVRVTLMTATSRAGEGVAIHRRMSARAMGASETLGAGARWQDDVPPAALLDARGLGDLREPVPRDARATGRFVVVSHRLPLDDIENGATWIVVPETLWASPTPPSPWRTPALLPFPMGSAENRWLRRLDARAKVRDAATDRAIFTALCSHSQALRAGHFVARPLEPARIRLEALG